MAEGVTVGNNGGVAAYLAFGAVGEEAQDCLAFKVRDGECNGWYTGDILRSYRDDTAGFYGYAAVDRAETGILSASYRTCNMAERLPVYVRLTRVERQVKPALSVSKYSNIHHHALVHQPAVSGQVEQHSLVILIICGIEACDVD